MPDHAPLEANIRAAASDILAGFDRELIPTNTAIAITGLVFASLLTRVDKPFRNVLLAALKAEADA